MHLPVEHMATVHELKDLDVQHTPLVGADEGSRKGNLKQKVCEMQGLTLEY